MSRERFDFVFALGSGCACSRMLRERGLQFASFPLDWVGGISFAVGAGGALRQTAGLIVSDFANWFLEENLVRTPDYDSSRYDAYLDRGTGLYFTHDIPRNGDLHTCYPSARDRYERRIARFAALAGSARKMLAVWVSDPRDPGEIVEEDVRAALASLRGRYPQAEIRLLVVGCLAGTPPERAVVSHGDGWDLMLFDYRVVTVGKPTWDIRTELFSPLLDRYEAVDYRTRAEKRANAKRERAREYEKFKATSPLDLILTKMRFKLYRHLRRRLERKGVLLQQDGGLA